jgi:hypothetical protein
MSTIHQNELEHAIQLLGRKDSILRKAVQNFGLPRSRRRSGGISTLALRFKRLLEFVLKPVALKFGSAMKFGGLYQGSQMTASIAVNLHLKGSKRKKCSIPSCGIPCPKQAKLTIRNLGPNSSVDF